MHSEAKELADFVGLVERCLLGLKPAVVDPVVRRQLDAISERCRPVMRIAERLQREEDDGR